MLAAVAGAVFTTLFAASNAHAIVEFSTNGANPAAIQSVVDGFRASLGTSNANTPVVNSGGRREVNWDAVPDAFEDPAAFPGNFFNGSTVGRARGIVFSTSGAFLVSSDGDAGDAPLGFGFGTAAGQSQDFQPFSPARMFAITGSLVMDVTFFSPADQTTSATTRGFGAVFEDVERADVTKLEYFDAANGLLHTQFVPANGTSGTLSFAGTVFDAASVARVRITAGDSILLANGSYGAGLDGVVMDDFIYGEPLPVPEPSTWMLFAAGIGLLGWGLRRR